MKSAVIIQKQCWSLLSAGFLLLMLSSCVSEDEIDFPEDPNTGNFTESIAVISVLRAVENKLLTDSSCLRLSYPIHLQFNNDIQITVSDLSGLSELAGSVTKNQHINAVEFPLMVSKNGVIAAVENEADFIKAQEDCGIPTLRDEFDLYFTQCFDLVYPLEMYDSDSNVVTISSKEAYFDFEFEQGFDKQPKFIYPISVFDYANQSAVPVETPFELFKIFDSCKRCPELSFRIDTLAINRYQFIADFEEIDRVSTYDWYIDGIKVETDGPGVQGDNKLTETFESGEYEICIKTSLPDDDCSAGTEYCKTISVDTCPFVSFETEQLSDNSYKFIANFPTMDIIDYSWVIYRNAENVFSEIEDEQGDNKLTFQFEPGVYEVCIEAEPPGCPQVVDFCQEFIFE